jgi:alpha-L-fucosidase
MTKRVYDWPNHYGDFQWFIEDRFGLFIHWGLYALPARHEWVMTKEKIHSEQYRKYMDRFNPDLFNAREWAKNAKKAGIKYAVLTTKHHEGFAMWDSDATDYKVTNSPYGKDVVREFADAFRAEGIKIGFYHSLIDWHHPDFTIDGLHSLRENEEEKAKKREFDQYVQYLHQQVHELLTSYGKIDYLWFDFSYPDRDWDWSKGKGAKDWKAEELEALILKLQPHIILNNRLDLNRGVYTPEQYQPKRSIKKDGLDIVWEACQTLNGSWGYDRDELHWKSPEMVIKMLIDTVSKNGNLLLNIGPNARGEWDLKSMEIMERISEWMKYHDSSIYGAGESEFPSPPDCRLTQKDQTIYLHIFSWPFRTIHLSELAGKIEYVQFLHDHSEVKFYEYMESDIHHHNVPVVEACEVVLEIPVIKPDVLVPVIEIKLKEDL